MRAHPHAICLMGPTASGKTDLAIALHQQGGYELISVDSALIYRQMDIGTAKPDAQTLAQHPHALVDICDPSETYSAARFQTDALTAMDAIVARGNTPVLVGGTMLYFKALLEGLSPLPSADARCRAEIERQALAQGWASLHAELAQVDPDSAQRIHPNDPQRLMRALEVYRISGKTLTEWAAEPVIRPNYHFFQYALIPNQRTVLHHRIERRFDLMLKQGFIEEVEALRARGDLDLSMPSMRCVGYRQVWEYLDGNYDHATMVEKGLAATRQLAKRQLTWLRGWSQLEVFDTSEGLDSEAALALIRNHTKPCL